MFHLVYVTFLIGRPDLLVDDSVSLTSNKNASEPCLEIFVPLGECGTGVVEEELSGEFSSPSANSAFSCASRDVKRIAVIRVIGGGLNNELMRLAVTGVFGGGLSAKFMAGEARELSFSCCRGNSGVEGPVGFDFFLGRTVFGESSSPSVSGSGSWERLRPCEVWTGEGIGNDELLLERELRVFP